MEPTHTQVSVVSKKFLETSDFPGEAFLAFSFPFEILILFCICMFSLYLRQRSRKVIYLEKYNIFWENKPCCELQQGGRVPQKRVPWSWPCKVYIKTWKNNPEGTEIWRLQCNKKSHSCQQWKVIGSVTGINRSQVHTYIKATWGYQVEKCMKNICAYFYDMSIQVGFHMAFSKGL